MSVCSGRATQARSAVASGLSKRQKLDLGRVRGKQREVDTYASPGSSQGIGVAGPHAHDGRASRFVPLFAP